MKAAQPSQWYAPFACVLVAGFALFLFGTYSAPGAAQSATATNTYDDAGRLRTTTYSDGKAVGYELDAAGNRTSTAEGALPQFSIAAASATEGSNLVFAVTKTGTATGTITIECVQTDGSATAGGDYTASTQVLTFLIADTSKNCTVPSLPDSAYESAHTFSALLQKPVGAAKIATTGAVGTINDNDTAPSFSVSGGSASEGSAIQFTITKTGNTQLSHSISCAANHLMHG